MNLCDLTFREARDHLARKPELIIPVGTCEQHGPHLPLGTDTLIAEYFARVLSDECGALVAPAIQYGINLPCDRGFHGTASLSGQTLAGTVADLTDWWRGQGIRRFILITFHGDPYHLEALRGVGGDVVLLEPAEADGRDILERQEAIRHACEAETSVMMALFPDRVREDQIEESDIPFLEFEDCLFHRRACAPAGYIGCLGFPASATREKGEKLVRRMTAELLAEYRNIP